jgi:predicted GIY-YIG superfamily endonuclease
VNALEDLREYHPDRPYWLYRYYDHDGELLYIGITRHPEVRLAQHWLYEDWAKHVARKTVDGPVLTRAEVRALERAAIKGEVPMFNGTNGDVRHILKAIAYVEANGGDLFRYHNRLARLALGNKSFGNETVAEFVAGFHRGEYDNHPRIGLAARAAKPDTEETQP